MPCSGVQASSVIEQTAGVMILQVDSVSVAQVYKKQVKLPDALQICSMIPQRLYDAEQVRHTMQKTEYVGWKNP